MINSTQKDAQNPGETKKRPSKVSKKAGEENRTKRSTSFGSDHFALTLLFWKFMTRLMSILHPFWEVVDPNNDLHKSLRGHIWPLSNSGWHVRVSDSLVVGLQVLDEKQAFCPRHGWSTVYQPAKRAKKLRKRSIPNSKSWISLFQVMFLLSNIRIPRPFFRMWLEALPICLSNKMDYKFSMDRRLRLESLDWRDP